MFKFLATVLLCGIFIAAGASKLQDPNATADGIKASPSIKLALKTVGYAPKPEEFVLAAQAAGAVEIGGAALLILGVARCLAVFALTAFTIVATMAFHMDMNKPQAVLENKAEMIHVLKNLAIIGGLWMACYANCASSNKGCESSAEKKVAAKSPSAAKKRQ